MRVVSTSLLHTSAIPILPRAAVPPVEYFAAMAKRESTAPEFTRMNARVPTALAARVDEVRARLRRDGTSVSSSAFVEVALEELLSQRDLAAILRKRGAKARRD